MSDYSYGLWVLLQHTNALLEQLVEAVNKLNSSLLSAHTSGEPAPGQEHKQGPDKDSNS